MNNNQIVSVLFDAAQNNQLDIAGADKRFYTKLVLHAAEIRDLYTQLYKDHPAYSENLTSLIETLISAHHERSEVLRIDDQEKNEDWLLSNQISGMSLYIDQFCGTLKNFPNKLNYLQELGVNFIHILPVFQSPETESDGGYAVSDFQKVDKKLGTIEDLRSVISEIRQKGMSVMLDIAFNHTSHEHEWAQKAAQGDQKYQDYYHFFPDRTIPDQYDQSMIDIFPEHKHGNFTFNDLSQKWVMTIFHKYQWDLNYSNPEVFIEMLKNVLFYSNLGIDVLTINATQFLWKELKTNCQNLPQTHTLLQLIKQCLNVVAPGVALANEAITSPTAMMQYFGEDRYLTKECQISYNSTQMALQWDALATGNTSIMLDAQQILNKKPFGTTWLNYTRSHDEISFGFDDITISSASYDPLKHRDFLLKYFTGNFPNSPASGVPFSEKNETYVGICGTLASLCGLENANKINNEYQINLSIQKILLMQANSFLLGGIPMIFAGDEVGYFNDYTYLSNLTKKLDNRWIHRPKIDWDKNDLAKISGTIENRIFLGTNRLIQIRKKLSVLSDTKNISWLPKLNMHIAGFLRGGKDNGVFCIFNYSDENAYLTFDIFKHNGFTPKKMFDHWSETNIYLSQKENFLTMTPYSFYILEVYF